MRRRLEGKLLLALALWAVVIAVLVGIRSIHVRPDAELFLVQTLGILDVATISWIIPVLLWLLPMIVIQYYLGDYISRKLDNHAVYLFTRTSKRGQWFIGECYNVIKYILFFQLIEIAAVVSVGIVIGVHIEDKIPFVMTIFEIYVLSALGLMVSVLCVNVLSLFISSVISSIIVFLANVVCIMSAGYLYDNLPSHNNVVQWIPFTQNVYAWQYSIYSSTDEIDFSHPSGYIFALAYLIIAGSVILFSGLLIIKNKDIY